MLTLHYDHSNGIERAILTRKNQVQDCFFAPLSNPPQTGAVYRGVIDRVMANGKGAFVKLPNGSNGFMNDPEGLQAGAPVQVQVKSEAREGKGVGLTRNISLPGVYLIYQPNGDGLNFSRRMSDAECDAAQARLQGALDDLPGGWVLRRAAMTASPDLIAREARELSIAPLDAGITPPSAFEQAVLSVASEPGFQIVVEQGTDIAAHYFKSSLPGLLGQLNISHMKNAFDQHDLEGFYARLRAPRVELPKGGSLIFEHTNTLNVIDVNAGDRTHHLEVNCEAAREVMKQIKWRNIGGLIVIDFLKTKQRDDRQQVLDIIYDEVGQDAFPCDIYGFSRMGLCELSRARRGFSLGEMA